MSRKRRGFDIDIPDAVDIPVGKTSDRALRRGPMASAIAENATSLRDRQEAEQVIREENDRLAREFVRLKKEGLVTDRIPLDAVISDKLVRDRRPGEDEELEELKASIREIGLSNPIRVEAREDGKYELIQGLRRLMAFRSLNEEAPGFDMIPAGILPFEPKTADTYRRMVDENLIRRDISFAEMATLARRYADDSANACPDVSDAVAVLFKSASYVKRSYIRAFAELLAQLGDVLNFSHDIPRNVGVELKRRLDRDAELRPKVEKALQAEPDRDSAREVAILRGFAQDEAADDATLPTDKVSKTPPKQRNPKTTFQVPLPVGVVKCSASLGRLELRDDRDFSTIDRRKLERAVAAFYAALDKS